MLQYIHNTEIYVPCWHIYSTCNAKRLLITPAHYTLSKIFVPVAITINQDFQGSFIL